MNEPLNYPLQWPFGLPRTKPENRKSSQFKQTFSTAKKALYAELARFDALPYTISSNLAIGKHTGEPIAGRRAPEDMGVAVYFKRGGRDIVIAVDQYDQLHDNIYAIAKTIEAMRSIERWGSKEMADRAASGFAALPAPKPKNPWREVLRIATGYTTKEMVNDQYHRLAKIYHPDRGGSAELMAELNRARDEALAEIGQ